MIVEDCIGCDICIDECPNEAILAGDDAYRIDGDRCTECVGDNDAPACVAVCPVDAVIPDLSRVETRDELLAKVAA